jgi:hypothetical protein
MSNGGELPSFNGRPLLGAQGAGRPSKVGVMKVGPTVGRLAMAQRWVPGRRGATALGEATTLSWARGGRKGVPLWWAGWDAQARWLMGRLGQNQEEKLFWDFS